MTKVMPIKSTAHQNSWNIWQNVSEISLKYVYTNTYSDPLGDSDQIFLIEN